MSEADAQIRRWRRQKRAERARAMSEDRLTLEAGGIDEVVVDGCLAHLERLDTGHYFLCLSKPDGSELAIWLRAEKGKITTSFERRPA